MSKQAIKRAGAISAVLALAAAPAALAAKPDSPGGQGESHANGHSKAGGKAVVSYVFKGTYAGDGSVAVDHGNAHVRKADLVGTTVSFDLTNARIVVADTNGDSQQTADDVQSGDRVVVKARLPRKEPGTQPYAAKQLVDQTHEPNSP
jgi:hypothetical protein